jgi:hypothetical protein
MDAGRASRYQSLSDHTPSYDLAKRVERILATRGFTLSRVSREVRQRYGGRPHHLVPHDFYYDLSLPGYSPRIEQVLALSRVTNYRLADWLAVFEIHLDDVPRLQAQFPSTRTSILDATTYDRAAWIEWFRDITGDAGPPAVAPLGRLLASAHSQRIDSLLPSSEPSRFLYAKIGKQDAFAFPDLLPGSIVRANSRGLSEFLESMTRQNSERLFLVEYAQGFVCSRLYTKAQDRITLRAATLPFAQPELRLGTQARILGVLDWELRPFKIPQAEVPKASMKFLQPWLLPAIGTHTSLREFLERARSRGGLSVRNASTKSRLIAAALRDERYFCSPNSLTHYETDPRLPAQMHKLVSLCVLYSLNFTELLVAAGLDARDSGHEPIPDVLVGRRTMDSLQVKTEASATNEKQPGFLSSLIAQFQEIPFFLRHSLSSFAGLSSLSIRDVFWTGGRVTSLHPYLKDAVFVSVNRRLKNPVFLGRKWLWEQSPYILLLRDGTYLFAGCSLEGCTLIVHPFSDGLSRPLMLRNGVDAEIIGKVTGLFRWLR